MLDPLLSRRQALSRMSAFAAAGTIVASTAADAADPPLPILDTHQHLWDLTKFKLPWLASNERLARSFVTSDYQEATRGLNFVKSVYMEVDVAPEQQQAEAEHVISLCASGKHPTTAAVISGRPASDAFAAYIRPLAARPYIKGVRQVLHGAATPEGYCLDPAFVLGIRLLGELGLRYDLCMRSAELSDAVKLVAACPDTRFVLDHCGNIDPHLFAASGVGEAGVRSREQWKRDILALSQQKHVICKISGIVAQAKSGDALPELLAPAIQHCLESFGPKRVVFGSDWPVCTLGATLASWVAALKQIVAERPLVEQRRLFHDNAAEFYGLT